MKTKLTRLLTFILVFATICVFIAGCKPKSVEGEKNITCELVVNSGKATMTVICEGKDNVVYECEISSGLKSVEDVLNALADETEFEYSVKKFGDDAFVQSMMDILAVAKEKEYFAFYIDEEYASFGITETEFEEGVNYKFVLSTW